MSNERFSEAVQATYMSQAEANDVMELWQRRQKEDAARQAMVTIHDVAEATQLSPQEIQQLLQDVRSSKPVALANPTDAHHEEDVPLVPALFKVAPISGIIAFLLFLATSEGPRILNGLQALSFFWAGAVCIFMISRVLLRASSKQQALRAERDSLVRSIHSPDQYR